MQCICICWIPFPETLPIDPRSTNTIDRKCHCQSQTCLFRCFNFVWSLSWNILRRDRPCRVGCSKQNTCDSRWNVVLSCRWRRSVLRARRPEVTGKRGRGGTVEGVLDPKWIRNGTPSLVTAMDCRPAKSATCKPIHRTLPG